MLTWNRDNRCGKYANSTRRQPRKITNRDFAAGPPSKSRITALFVDSKAHVGLNLQKLIAASFAQNAQKCTKMPIARDLDTEPRASATGLAGPSATPQKSPRGDLDRARPNYQALLRRTQVVIER
jgi:hypothetical protein